MIKVLHTNTDTPILLQVLDILLLQNSKLYQEVSQENGPRRAHDCRCISGAYMLETCVYSQVCAMLKKNN